MIVRNRLRAWSIATVVMGAVVVGAVAAAGAGGGVVDGDAAAFLLREGVVVSADREVLFTQRAAGGVAAIDSATGAVRWSSKLAAEPVAVRGELLVARVESDDQLVLVLLEAASGRQRAKLEAPLPAGVRGLIDDRLGERFSLRALPGGSELRLVWHFVSEQVAAAVAMDGVPIGGSRDQRQGAFLVDLVQQTVSPAGAPETRLPVASFDELTAEQALPGLDGRQFSSADGRSVLLSRVEATGDEDRYLWQIHARDDGDRLGSLMAPVSVAPFFVSGSRLVFESGLAIRHLGEGRLEVDALALLGVDVPSGVEQWRLEIRDTAYRGPFPP